MNTNTLARWDFVRIALMALCISGVSAVLVKELFHPKGDTEKITTQYSFPNKINLTNWQQTKSEIFKLPKKVETEQVFANRKYLYSQGNKNLQVKTVYETATEGNVSRLLMMYESIPPATVVINEKYSPEIGTYGSFEYKDRAYISACINPKGETTVTQKQFVKNRYLHTGSLPRFFGWLTGQNDLFDGRCLWVSLSVPVNSFAPPAELKKSKDLLESTSLEWIRWWKQNYPES